MIDPFLWFCLPKEDQRFLEQYTSPSTETSLFKWIPVEHKHRVRELCLKLGLRVRVVYRGPRRGQCVPSYTRCEDATHFSIYTFG